jgi:hypothetical protein
LNKGLCKYCSGLYNLASSLLSRALRQAAKV